MKYGVIFVIGLFWMVAEARPTRDDDRPREEGIPVPVEPVLEAPTRHLDSVRKGLDWLARHQNDDGSFGNQYRVTVTSLACLAFMANGSLPGQGPYQKHISGGLDFILSRQTRSGVFAETSGKVMHSHGYATLFLAELYGTQLSGHGHVDLSELKYRLKKAIQVIERSQSTHGGWYYFPDPDSDEGSVTVTLVQALRSARNVGLSVNLNTIDKAFEYLRKSCNDDGSISYSLTERSSSYALTAAGMTVLNYLGEYQGKEIDLGLEYLRKSFERPPEETGRGNFPYYEDFYATLAFYQVGGPTWSMYYPRIRDNLLSIQKEDGSWDGAYGGEYGTAFTLLILQVPYRYLPILQR